MYNAQSAKNQSNTVGPFQSKSRRGSVEWNGLRSVLDRLGLTKASVRNDESNGLGIFSHHSVKDEDFEMEYYRTMAKEGRYFIL